MISADVVRSSLKALSSLILEDKQPYELNEIENSICSLAKQIFPKLATLFPDNCIFNLTEIISLFQDDDHQDDCYEKLMLLQERVYQQQIAICDRKSNTLEKLKLAYDDLVVRYKTSHLSLYDLLDFQEKLTNASPSMRDKSEYQELVEGIENLVNIIFTNIQIKPLKDTAFNSSTSFVYNDEQYVIKFTRGRGSCALHALLGEEIQGVYRFTGDNPDVQAKKYFTDALEESLHNDDEIIAIFVNILMDYFYDSKRAGGTFEAKILFSKSQGLEVAKELSSLQEP